MSSNSLPPPVPPPRPYSTQLLPPPIPQPQLQDGSGPHYDHPLAAPRPTRIDPSIPENISRTLDQMNYINYEPGFAPPRGTTPNPPPHPNAAWSPWLQPQPQQHDPYGPQPANGGLAPPHIRQRTFSSPNMQSPAHAPQHQQISPSFNQDFTFGGTPQPRPGPPARQSTYGPIAKPPTPPAATPSLTAPLPSLNNLFGALQAIQNPTHDINLKISWSRDVLFLIDKHLGTATTTDAPIGPATIDDPQLIQLMQVAVPTVLQLASAPGIPPAISSEATYWRATFAASGAYPEHVPHNPRAAFRDFEAAARGGYAAAWFRLGRDYEQFNDVSHAKDCFERGVKFGVESCAYRMGMAHLIGQLGLPANPNVAMPLLHRAATIATARVPQPAYIYALLLLNEFPSLPGPLPTNIFHPFIPQGSNPLLEARKHLERAAYLGFAPAQYKLGHAYEFAQPPFPFDPLLSVQYYSLASQQGEVEADMALSKWFLCGSGTGEDGGGALMDEGGFEKDEGLAYTFAEKAARKGLPSAEFAMGYYAEVGVGGPKDLQAALKWYTRARDHGNADAAERLAALQQPDPAALSRQEHDAITETKLVRKRTQAKQRSQAQIPVPTVPSAGSGSGFSQASGPGLPSSSVRNKRTSQQVVDLVRKNSMAQPPMGGPHPPPAQQQAPSLTPAQQYQQQYQQGQGGGGRGGPQHPQPPLHHQQSMPAPTLRPQQGQGQPYPQAHRYTLTDAPSPPGSRPASGAGLGLGLGGPQMVVGSGRGRGGAGRMGGGGGLPGGPHAQGPPGPLQDFPPVGGNAPVQEDPHEAVTTPGLGGGIVYAAKPGKGPTTFAEMGFQGAKAEDKDCVIM